MGIHFLTSEKFNQINGMNMKEIEKARKQGKKIVLVGGVFDLIHPGHIYFLGQAKRKGDFLVVVIATRKRGKQRKLINSAERRAEIAASLKPVDMAIVGHRGDILDIVEEIRPDLIVLGPDQKFREKEILKNLRERGLKTNVTRIEKKFGTYSTTAILKKAKKIKV